MEVKRGDLVTLALAGDCGKPRPALVVQSDAFGALDSVTVLRLTSDLHDWPLFRITIEPHEDNGLHKPSQIMIDKAATVPKSKIGRRIGQTNTATMKAVSAALGRFLELG